MKIPYEKKRLNSNLIFGIIWLVFALLSLNYREDNHWIDYGYLLICFLYLGIYFYQKKYNYLRIEQGIINVGGPFRKKLKLIEIKRIRKFAGDYILKTDKHELTVNTQIIGQDSLVRLDDELEKLNVEWS